MPRVPNRRTVRFALTDPLVIQSPDKAAAAPLASHNFLYFSLRTAANESSLHYATARDGMR